MAVYLILSAVLPPDGFAADFSITPIRIFFDERAKTSALNVTNESGEGLTLQLKVFAWQQDEEGKDVYTPTEDIIFFPKIFELEKQGNKLVRLGTEVPFGSREKTYRLYLEELPEPHEQKTTAVRILMRVGVPIFIQPLNPEVKGRIEAAVLQKGSLSFRVRNEGNTHFIIKKILVQGLDEAGGQLFTTEAGGGYLHGDTTRGFAVEIPADGCLQAKTLHISVDTDKLSMDEEIAVSKEMCTF